MLRWARLPGGRGEPPGRHCVTGASAPMQDHPTDSFRSGHHGYLAFDINGRTGGPSSEVSMGIGLSVFLIAVGAILTWAVHATVSGIAIHTVGVILMIAGALGLIVTMTIFAPRRRSVVADRAVTTEPVGTPVVAGTRERVVERDVY